MSARESVSASASTATRPGADGTVGHHRRHAEEQVGVADDGRELVTDLGRRRRRPAPARRRRGRRRASGTRSPAGRRRCRRGSRGRRSPRSQLGAGVGRLHGDRRAGHRGVLLQRQRAARQVRPRPPRSAPGTARVTSDRRVGARVPPGSPGRRPAPAGGRPAAVRAPSGPATAPGAARRPAAPAPADDRAAEPGRVLDAPRSASP